MTQGTPSLYVDNQEETGFFNEKITINCYYTTSGEMKWCKMNSNCVTERSGLIDGTRVNLNNRRDNRFTVTLSELSPESSGWYYCVKGDFQMPVHLSVTERPAEIYKTKTVSEVSVKAGASVTIPCFYSQQYRNHVKYLCEGSIWTYCSYAAKTNSQSDSEKYSISDDKSQSVFTVTIKQLTEQNTHYWCAVEIDNGVDHGRYFHLSVTQSTPRLYVDNQTVSGFIGENITINCYYTTSGEMKWCKMNSNCVTERSGLIDGTRVNLNNSDNRFTVTLRELSPESSGWYYCVKGDFQMPVHLSVTERPAEIYKTKTVSEVSVKAGASVTIPCFYSQKHRNHVKYLCNGYLWNSCSYAVKTNSQLDTNKYSISDDKHQSVFSVTIKQLTHQNTDYWCAVEINSGADDRHYFHLVAQDTPILSVDNQAVSGFIGENITINCYYTTSGEMKWCKMNSNCVTDRSGSVDGTKVNLNKSGNRFTVTLRELRAESSGWYYCVKGDFQMPVHLSVTERPTTEPTITPTIAGKTATTRVKPKSRFDLKILIIPSSLLILILIVALVVWLVLKCKHGKADSTTSKSSEEAVTYSDVAFKKRKAKARSVESGEDVTYSSVVTTKQKRQSKGEDTDVTYTTVFHHM
ncbi:uncharacterized protein LOC106515333 [Austrofundulus limnaeus]|uniref:Uncharacterized protein LOC106515333 n=1 Tax=Austrofundulus limnaeus TaxID=52670 RepID=A0A2I4AYE5_AUSLI|nr:PREDICTED: uncharacterized protein LOC106515333 [Austrofundulus limnaeus]